MIVHIIFILIGAAMLLLGLASLFLSKGAMQEAASAGVAALGAIMLVGGFAIGILDDLRRQVKDLALIVLGQCKTPEAGRLDSDQTDRIANAVKRTYRR